MTTYANGPTITVDPATPGITISTDFVGISYEHSYITLDRLKATNTALKNFFNLFGGKLNLRIGGNTSDTQIAPNAMIDNFANFIGPAGVAAVLYGLPGKFIAPSASDAAQAAVDAAIALRLHNILGDSIITYQLGNEVNFYSATSYATYAARWQTIHDAVVASVPSAKFAGCDDGTSSVSRPTFLLQFAPDKGSQCQYFTLHRYGAAGQNDPSRSIPAILNSSISFMNDAVCLPANSLFGGKKLRLAECGQIQSPTADGKTLGGSLWLLRAMVHAALNGWLGVNVHSNESLTTGYVPLTDNNNGTYNGGTQSSWLVPGDTYDGNGTYTANSSFYALRLFNELTGGQVLPTRHLLGNGFALGVKGADAKTRVLVINADLKASVSFPVTSTGAFTQATALILTAPSFDSTTGITLGGQQATPQGALVPQAQALTVASNVATLQLPPASSAVVTLT